MKWEKPSAKSRSASLCGDVAFRWFYPPSVVITSSLDRDFTKEGASPVVMATASVWIILESGCLRSQPKEGGKPHLRLNISMRPIANKYREGKLQRTLKREFNRT